jgi:hypothetical protein
MSECAEPNLRFAEAAPRLFENGYQPVPILSGSKRPEPDILQWQHYQFKDSDAKKYRNSGTGILCGKCVGVDIDVRDKQIAAWMRATAEELLGPAPARIGAAPKVLLLYAVDGEPFPKIQTAGYRLPTDGPEDKVHKVEVLAAGQQFVAYHVHPDTRLPYRWNGLGEPATIPLSMLPAVTLTQLKAFIAEADAELGRHGRRVGRLTQAASDDRQHAPSTSQRTDDPTMLRSALDHIPNCDLDYDDWVRVGLAVKGALGEDGRGAWLSWSAKSAKDTPEYSAKQWAAFKPKLLGAGTIFHHAEHCGWKRPSPAAPPIDLPPVECYEQDANEARGKLSGHHMPERIVWGIPADLWSAIAPTPPLPKGLLPPTLEQFAFGMPDTFNPAALAAAALATCSIAASDYVRLVINPTWRECYRIWIGLYGPSSAAKSPIINAGLRPLVAEQTMRFEEHAALLEGWIANQKAAKKANDAFDEPKPIAIRYFTNNCTIEALSEIARHTDHGVGLIHDELSALIAAMDGTYREKSAGERGNWLALYDGGVHLQDRIIRGEVFIRNHSASILGAITTDKLARIVRDSAADGLMSRMSLTSVTAMPPSADIEAMPLAVYREYEQLIARLIHNRPSRTHDVSLADTAREILGQAKKLWAAEAILYADTLPRYAERLGKLLGVAARVALGFAIIEAAETPGSADSGATFREFDLPRCLNADTMRRACAYVDYQAQHDLAFYAAAAGQEVLAAIALARRVAGWLLQLGTEQFQLGDVTRGLDTWRTYRSTDQLAALDLLDHMDWIRPSEDAYFRGVKFVRGVVWTVNPQAHRIYAERAQMARQVAAEAKRKLTLAVSGGEKL